MTTKINVKVEGTSPLLYNRFIDSEIDVTVKKRTGKAKGVPVEEKLYTLEDDGQVGSPTPYIPAIYFRNTMIEAGKQFSVVGKGKATYSKLIGSTVDVLPEKIPNNHKWDVLRIAAVNPNTKGRVMTERPKMDTWGCEFTIVLDDDSINADTIIEILEHAGKYVGIGDWRPAKKGRYGKFKVVEFKEVA